MKARIKEIMYALGADVCGIANIDRFSDAPQGFSPNDIYDDCRSVIVFGIALPKGITKVDPRIVYGHFNSNSCFYVDEVSFKAAKMIEDAFNCFAITLPCDSPYDFWHEDNKEGRGLISMKHAAVLAGIGTLGKNTLLLNKKFGNLLTIGAVLTNLDLESDELSENMCINGCNKCIDQCPAGAIKEGSVNQKLCRNNTYDQNKRGFDVTKCNICRIVCPVKFGK